MPAVHIPHLEMGKGGTLVASNFATHFRVIRNQIEPHRAEIRSIHRNLSPAGTYESFTPLKRRRLRRRGGLNVSNFVKIKYPKHRPPTPLLAIRPLITHLSSDPINHLPRWLTWGIRDPCVEVVNAISSTRTTHTVENKHQYKLSIRRIVDMGFFRGK